MVQERPVRVERRLSAILAADVAGYSRLMHRDEEATHAKLTGLLAEAVHPAIAEHGGRIVKNTGDGFLAEFPSAVEAVRAAMDFQARIHELAVGEPKDSSIAFRVGINIGDVIVEPHDIFGDGVNIAARLEGIAEPGGICISSAAYDQVRGRVGVEFADKGERMVKNIARPVHVYALGPDEVLSDIPASSEPPRATRRRGLRIVWLATSLFAALVLAFGIWTVRRPTQNGAGTAPRLSLVVLPFPNLSGDASQDYLADVITDELTTRLSRFPGSFVIAHSTALIYRGKPVDVRQIGKDLVVRYALEGSVQPNRDQIRVNAQLIETETGSHLWADQFDEDRANLLQMQDDIVARLARAVGVKMAAEAGRRVRARETNPDAEDLAWRCWAATIRGADLTPKEWDAGFRLCEQALQVDSRNVLALCLLSGKFSLRVLALGSADPQADIRRADELASLALQIEPDFYAAHAARGAVLLAEARYREAIDVYQRVLLLAPSYVPAYSGLAAAHNYLGEPEQAISYVDKAMRLSPYDPATRAFYSDKFVAYGILQDWEQALVWERRAEAARDSPFNGFASAALLALASRDAEARATMQRYLAGSNAPVRTIAQWQRVRFPATVDNARYLAWRQNFVEGLRKAGMPEG
jgi:class 3 adenylate cyclase/TolB-like protein